MFGPCQWWIPVFGWQVGVHVGKQDLLVFDELWHALIVTDGEGLPPVALAAKYGVAQPVVHAGRRKPGGFRFLDGDGQHGRATLPTPLAAVAQHGILVGAGAFGDVMAFENRRDVQPKGAGKLPVPLVSGRDSHDSTGSISGENVIGNPNGHRCSRERVQGTGTREAPSHAAVASHPFALAPGSGFLLIGSNGILMLSRCDVLDELVFWGQHKEVGAVEGVRPCGKHLDGPAFVVLDVKPQLCSGRLANPVALYLFDAVRPIDAVQTLEQTVSIGRDAHHPLAHFFAHHRMSSALTQPPDDLIVGQYSAQSRTPIDLAVGEVGQAIGHQNGPLPFLIQSVPLLGREGPFKIPAPYHLNGFGQRIVPDDPVYLGIALLRKV